MFSHQIPAINILSTILLLIVLLFTQSIFAEELVEESVENNSQVMQAFTELEEGESELIKIEDKEKRLIMFALGVPLLILLITTGVLGIAMAVYGKQVFVAHMVCAGLSVTLALAHAIIGIVWFYPF